MLNKAHILELFKKLDQRLEAKCLKGEIGVFGGAALCLLYNERIPTKDVDALFEPTEVIRKLVADIAEDENLPPDWLNDAVKGFIPEQNPEHNTIYDGKALLVWVPDPKYLFAMKALASRANTTDLSDIKLLISKIPIATLDEAVEVLHNYYPKGQISQKTYYFLEELFDKNS